MTTTMRHWLFDLDETLHHAGPTLFPLISDSMTRYMTEHLLLDEETANRLRVVYWRRYGATLGGLMKHHQVTPEHFLHYTHDMSVLLPHIQPSPQLVRLLQRLPGKKWIFSNGPQHYVEAICRKLGLIPLVEDCFGIERFGLTPKPRAMAYHRVLRHAGIAAGQCIMVEDTVANLRTAKQLGMHTVWLSRHHTKPAWVDRRITTLYALPRLQIRHAGGTTDA